MHQVHIKFSNIKCYSNSNNIILILNFPDTIPGTPVHQNPGEGRGSQKLLKGYGGRMGMGWDGKGEGIKREGESEMREVIEGD